MIFFCDEFDVVVVYVNFYDNPPEMFDPIKFKDLYLCKSCLKYIHRSLAYSFSGRKDAPNILSKAKLYFMWCMPQKKRVNLGFSLASQFLNVISFKRALILGSIITCIAYYVDLIDLDENDLHFSCILSILDLGCLDEMGLLHLEGGIQYFALSGLIVSRNMRVFSKPKEGVQFTNNTQSTSATAPQQSIIPLEVILQQI